MRGRHCILGGVAAALLLLQGCAAVRERVSARASEAAPDRDAWEGRAPTSTVDDEFRDTAWSPRRRAPRIGSRRGIVQQPESASEAPQFEPQFGAASWYGKRFHGRRTANGERYNMYEMTAAHKTLPFGANVRVTRLDKGYWVIVRINDRGPYARNRIIDLSYAAARRLDMLGSGSSRVRLDVLSVPETDEDAGTEDPPLPEPSPAPNAMTDPG